MITLAIRYISRLVSGKKRLREAEINALERAGLVGLSTTQSLTPKDTGFAVNSTYSVVADESGRQIRGPRADRNGNTIPTHPATGRLMVTNGSNCGYMRWIDGGHHGWPGVGNMAAGYAASREAFPRMFAEEKRRL